MVSNTRQGTLQTFCIVLESFDAKIEKHNLAVMVMKERVDELKQELEKLHNNLEDI